MWGFVRDPQDRRWWVGRRWLPWRPRGRDMGSGGDVGNIGVLDLGGDEPIGCAIALLIAAVVVALPFVLVMAIFVAEWLLVLLLLPIVVLVRVGFGMPWTIVARLHDKADGARQRYSVQVKGWRASRELIEDARLELQNLGTPTVLGGPLPEGVEA